IARSSRVSPLFSAGIILRTDIIKLQWRCSMNLHYDLSLDHCVVVHVGVEISEAAGREGSHLCCVKVVAYSDFECSGQDGDVLMMRMPVESNAVAAGHLQTDRKVAGGRCGVVFENGELRIRRQEGWRFILLNGIRGESVFRMLQ